MSALQKEVAQYDDFIFLDIEEKYSWRSSKLLMHFLKLTFVSKLMMTYI
ncbi:hypothetical protein GYH30_034641 [Glycine max]|nr:hypothetical protein GYH30_034641 [Glycine max]